MRIDITYPSVKKGSSSRRKMLSVLRWPFLAAAAACVIVNIAVGPPVWSPVALLALYMAWTLVFSIDLVEYNRISQSIKIVIWASILLIFVDIFLAPGWARFVVPIVCFGGLAVCAVLFLTNIETQKHNMLPLVLFLFLTIIGSAVGLALWRDHNWPYIVLGSVSATFLVALIIILRQDFLREIKRRFHIK